MKRLKFNLKDYLNNKFPGEFSIWGRGTLKETNIRLNTESAFEFNNIIVIYLKEIQKCLENLLTYSKEEKL